MHSETQGIIAEKCSLKTLSLLLYLYMDILYVTICNRGDNKWGYI